MLISDLEEGTRISIKASVGLDTIEFETIAMDVADKKDISALKKVAFSAFRGKYYKVVQLVRSKDGKPVQLYGSGIVCMVDGVIKEKPYIWPDTKVVKVNLPSAGPVHVLFNEKNPKSINRRENFRQWVGTRGVARVGLNKMTFDVVVKDMSATGMGIIFDNAPEESVGNVVHVTFTDVLRDRATGQDLNQVFSINGIVMRECMTEDGRKLLGCKVTDGFGLIKRLINDRQQRELMNRARQGHRDEE